jgi:hypothetical protein
LFAFVTNDDDRPDSLADHRGQRGQDGAGDLRRATDRIERRPLVVRVTDELADLVSRRGR